MPQGPQRLRVGTSVAHNASYDSIVDVLLDVGPPLEFLALGDFVYPDKRGDYVHEDPDKDGGSWTTQISLPKEFWLNELELWLGDYAYGCDGDDRAPSPT